MGVWNMQLSIPKIGSDPSYRDEGIMIKKIKLVLLAFAFFILLMILFLNE
jgi:hypothetical protein